LKVVPPADVLPSPYFKVESPPPALPYGPPPGWFAILDVDVLKPHIKSTLTTPGPLSPDFSGPLLLPVAPLDWAGLPRVTAGYHLDHGAGDVLVSYRLLGASGDGSEADLAGGGPVALRSRLDVHTIDLDYGSGEFLTDGVDICPAFLRDLRGGIGARIAST